jgi:hypothetical protein
MEHRAQLTPAARQPKQASEEDSGDSDEVELETFQASSM